MISLTVEPECSTILILELLLCLLDLSKSLMAFVSVKNSISYEALNIFEIFTNTQTHTYEFSKKPTQTVCKELKTDEKGLNSQFLKSRVCNIGQSIRSQLYVPM